MADERKRRMCTPMGASYLLRVWRVREEGGIVLRAALKSRHDAEWVGFASLEALVEALRAEMEEAGEPMGNGRRQAGNGA